MKSGNDEKLIKLIKNYGLKQCLVGRYIGYKNHFEFVEDSEKAFKEIEYHLTPTEAVLRKRRKR